MDFEQNLVEDAKQVPLTAPKRRFLNRRSNIGKNKKGQPATYLESLILGEMHYTHPPTHFASSFYRNL
jgi:hypothetical protein